MKFATGDAIVHPIRGAGVVERIVERTWQGNAESYYRIRLLGQSGTTLMIPTSVTEKLGIRCALSRSDIKQLWCILLATPRRLPDRYKELRYLLQGKLGTGDIFQGAYKTWGGE
jgi:RNA polymerase-interacting CarD/CdnL/TRCF family regulator